MDPVLTETAVLQMVRVKGRTNAQALADALGSNADKLAEVLGELQAHEWVADAGKLGTKMTEAGQTALARLLSSEREGVDRSAVTDGYERFCVHNAALKALMTRWQMRYENTPNDHTDATYDQAIITELCALHTAARDDITAIAQHSHRLSAQYPRRLDDAWTKLEAGDTTFFSRPIIDSYHTVWFELHEELIGLAGLTRAAEAAAGRAN